MWTHYLLYKFRAYQHIIAKLHAAKLTRIFLDIVLMVIIFTLTLLDVTVTALPELLLSGVGTGVVVAVFTVAAFVIATIVIRRKKKAQGSCKQANFNSCYAYKY